MAENVFEAVKQSVSTREAAAFYGIEVKRNGMACCPFHDDKNPSMKVDQRFHCFGCGEDGDVIDFTAKLFNLSPKEAAEKLAQDFGLIYDSQAPPRRRYVRQKNEAQKFREDRQRCYRVLSDYYYLLKKWEADRSPKTPEEEPHPRFVEAIQKKAYVEYLLDLFLYESEEEQKAWIAEHTAEITHLERSLKIMAENKPTNRERLREITDGIEQGIKELFESEKYMRYLSVMSRFHRYSVNNTMLIYMQKPDATLVAGYNKWKDQFERHVKKGEHPMTYIQNGDYLIPDLKLSQQPEKTLGKYGRMRKTYLKEHRPILYNQMLLNEKLYQHLLEIDETAQSRLEQMMPQLAKEAGATEELKASDPMKWVGLMNNCKAQAEEILMAELINS